MIAENTLPLLHWLLGLGNATYPFVSRPRVTEIDLQFVLYIVTLGASAFLRHLAQLRAMEQRAAELAIQKAELEGALKQAELETLRLRLNPHFLFNCLQNISALAADDAKTAGTMLARLGDLLRVALRGDYQTEITLADEAKLTQAYVSIEQVRFGDRLSVLFEIGLIASLPMPSNSWQAASPWCWPVTTTSCPHRRTSIRLDRWITTR
jgi:sensor histidine kinase YesM